MGEGSGIVTIERLDHALARGATPLAEIVGYGSSCDAFRITDIQPDGRGAAAAMGMALNQAGIDPSVPPCPMAVLRSITSVPMAPEPRKTTRSRLVP